MKEQEKNLKNLWGNLWDEVTWIVVRLKDDQRSTSEEI